MNSHLRGLVRHVPTLLVLAGLLAVGLLGHRTGWTIPPLKSLFGAAADAEAEKEDWCAAHNVPDSKCIACHPELAGGDPNDWCKEHGVPESQCTVCHPEILTKGVAADWCTEHGVPESQCTLCHPEIAVKRSAPEDPSGITVTQGEGAAAAAGAAKNPATCQTHAVRVQFASKDSVRKAGVSVEAVEERPMAAFVRANAAIDYDQTRVAHLAARAPGAVWRVTAELGQAVKKGQLLALINSAAVGQAKTEFLNAMAALDVRTRAFERVKASSTEGFRSNAELLTAEAELREAKLRLLGAEQALTNLDFAVSTEALRKAEEEEVGRRLRFLGIAADVAKELEGAAAPSNLLPVFSPMDGVIVDLDAVVGEMTSEGKALFVVADVSRMWALLDVQLEDLALVKVGQAVTFRADVSSAEAVAGSVTWTSTAVDDKTRTVKVRAEFENPEGLLRARTFGAARVTIRSESKAIALPSAAIHWEGCCHVVFVQLTEDIFQTRKVRLGARNGQFTEVVVGVMPGEVVATTGSHVLKSALLKSQLGAGCVDD
jgi:cobalt-zinc-cadmium efflux system membrane fusion protein